MPKQKKIESIVKKLETSLYALWQDNAYINKVRVLQLQPNIDVFQLPIDYVFTNKMEKNAMLEDEMLATISIQGRPFQDTEQTLIWYLFARKPARHT